MMRLRRLSWRRTRALIRADYRRLVALLEAGSGEAPVLAAVHPSFVCVFLFRIASHLHRAGHRYRARLVWHLNVLLTGADISAPADIGRGFVVLAPPGTAVSGKAGRNLTLMPLAGIGGELGRREDVGGGPGLPVIGHDVVLEPNCGVLGPVRIGDRVRIGAAIAVTRDVPDDTVAEAHPPRHFRRTVA